MGFLFTIIQNVCTVYSFILVIYALLSWFPGAYQTGLGRLVIMLSEPVLKPFRRLPVRVGGLDFSVMIAVAVIQFIPYLLAMILVRIF